MMNDKSSGLVPGEPELRGPRGVADHEVKSAGRDFSESRVAIERHGDANSGILTREAKAALKQAIVDFVYVKSVPFFAQQ